MDLESRILQKVCVGLWGVQCQDSPWWQDAGCYLCWNREPSQTAQLCFCSCGTLDNEWIYQDAGQEIRVETSYLSQVEIANIKD